MTLHIDANLLEGIRIGFGAGVGFTVGLLLFLYWLIFGRGS